MTNEKIRLIIVDDHPVFLEGMEIILKREENIEIIAKTGSSLEAIELSQNLKPDIVLLDVNMPDIDGIEAITLIKAAHPPVRIIMVSSHVGEDIIYQAFQLGVMAYLPKESFLDDVVSTIYSVYKGNKVIPPAIALKLAQRISEPSLSEREREVLQLIASGLSNNEIALKLQITSGTAKLHVHNILVKLGASDRAAAITIAIRKGIIRL